MARYSNLNDRVLLQKLEERAAQDRKTTVDLLELIGEVDLRKLYRGEGYPSMFAYCMGKLCFSDDVAYKRIRVARAARRFPVLLEYLADGRQHLSGICVIAPHLTRENIQELLASTTHETTRKIEQLIRERFPQPDLPTKVWAVPAAKQELATWPVQTAGPVVPAGEPAINGSATSELATWPVAPAMPPAPPARLAPLAPQRFGLQVTMDQEMHDLLREAQELLSHQVPGSDVKEVLRRVLKLGVEQLRKRKFADTCKPRASARPSNEHSRSIPAPVQRAVWKRDGGQCTFVGESGHRCKARESIEFDHALPVARDGRATASNLRLRCRAHNQFEAERTFGTDFMQNRRERARQTGG